MSGEEPGAEMGDWEVAKGVREGPWGPPHTCRLELWVVNHPRP